MPALSSQVGERDIVRAGFDPATLTPAEVYAAKLVLGLAILGIGLALTPLFDMALEGDRLIHVPAFPVHAVDTTGAGDVFRAGFVYGALSGWPTADILRFANAAAAVSCTRLGAISAIPTLAEVEELLRDTVEINP
jgi:hypothetical protein